MRNALAFSAFSCEIVPNSGSVLYPLLVSKDTERYFISPLWLWDSRALEAWHQADFFEFAGSWWVEESKRCLEKATRCFQKAKKIPGPEKKPSSKLVFDCHGYSLLQLLQIFCFFYVLHSMTFFQDRLCH